MVWFHNIHIHVALLLFFIKKKATELYTLLPYEVSMQWPSEAYLSIYLFKHGNSLSHTVVFQKVRD